MWYLNTITIELQADISLKWRYPILEIWIFCLVFLLWPHALRGDWGIKPNSRARLSRQYTISLPHWIYHFDGAVIKEPTDNGKKRSAVVKWVWRYDGSFFVATGIVKESNGKKLNGLQFCYFSLRFGFLMNIDGDSWLRTGNKYSNGFSINGNLVFFPFVMQEIFKK